MKIRKQIYESTPEDLSKFPVWKFASEEEGQEGQNEATVRPYELSGPLDPSDGKFIVRASFTLADGSKMTGYLIPPADKLYPCEVTADRVRSPQSIEVSWTCS